MLVTVDKMGKRDDVAMTDACLRGCKTHRHVSDCQENGTGLC